MPLDVNVFEPLDTRRAAEEALQAPDFDPISAASMGAGFGLATGANAGGIFNNITMSLRNQLMTRAFPIEAWDYIKTRIIDPFTHLRMANPDDEMYKPTITRGK